MCASMRVCICVGVVRGCANPAQPVCVCMHMWTSDFNCVICQLAHRGRTHLMVLAGMMMLRGP